MNVRSIGTPSLVRQLGVWRGQGREPAYRQLANAVRLLILDGRLPLGTRLPGERELAVALDLSRTTVTAAFLALRDEGYLASRQGSGSVTRVPDRAGSRPAGEAAEVGGGIIDFATASVPASESVYHAYDRALAALPLHLPGHGYERIGLDSLRAAIAARYTRQGCPTSPGEIMVTNGAVHGFALVLRLLAGPGDRIVVDHPTYPHAIDAVQQAACRAVPVGLGGEGWDADAIETAFRQTAPRLAYFIADFHNPTGLLMDAATRLRVAEAAARLRTTVVVDETMADLWLGAAPPPSLAAYDRAGRVIALGSTGKSYWGGLRIGWIRASVDMIDALVRARPVIDLGTPILEQLAAATLVSEEEQALDARRAQLRRQRDAAIALLARYLPDWRVAAPPGGLSLWAELPAPVSTALAAISEGYGVRIAAGPRFGVDGAFERFVRLPFALPEAALETGIERLAAACQATRLSRHRAGDVHRAAGAAELVY
jgi:DNA-binding transcriptional MocR family regulator